MSENPTGQEPPVEKTEKPRNRMGFGAKLMFLILLLIIGGGGFAAWKAVEAKGAAAKDLEQKIAQLTQESANLKQQAAACEESKKQVQGQLEQLQKADCKGVWTPENGCQEPPQIFTAPVGGETFCFGTTVDVKWDPSLVKSDSVDVMLATSSNSGKLATLQNSEGAYHWQLEPKHKTVGDGGSFTIGEGMYKLRLQTKDGALLGKDTAMFTLKKCGGKTAKPAGRKKRK